MRLVDARRGAGYSLRQLAHTAGVSYQAFTRVVRLGTAMQRDTYNQLRATPPTHEPSRVPMWPLTRRVRSLQAIGFSQARISRDLNLDRSVVSQISRGVWETVTVDVDRLIRSYYSEHSLSPAGTPTRGAEKGRWPVPFQWENIDDPNEVRFRRMVAA